MPNSLSRYRPAILVVAGVAAALAGYHVYNISQASASTGLHRSNAVRRNARQRRQATQAARLLARLEGEPPITLGSYSLSGTNLSLNPQDVGSPNELRAAIVEARPLLSVEEVEEIADHVYSVFLDRLLLSVSPNRPLNQVEAEAFARWVGTRVPDSNTVLEAIERHASHISTQFTNALDGAESVALTDVSWGSDDDTEGDEQDHDGQTLQRTLYHIAEERARQEGVVHRGITCNGCDEKPIRGIRWHCANCPDFDLCSNCESTNSHIKTHIFYKIRVPAPYLSMGKQEPLYPGKPHLITPSVNSALKRRLIAETKMEAEEIEALWDQFTCLAGTEWPADPNKIGWALDRRAFNHAFIPRYNSFVAAPNLVYDRIFAYYDTDKNGLIGFEEWIKGLDGLHTASGHAKARIVFSGYDIDGDGYISRKDILRIFRAYYAIEKEATRNYIAEITEELSVRHALETIRSSQPLGSAFTPHGYVVHHLDPRRLQDKHADDYDNASPVIRDDQPDTADREDILKTTDLSNLPPGSQSEDSQDDIVSRRWAHRQFYTDEEEGLAQPEGIADVLRHTEDADNSEETMYQEGRAIQNHTRPARSSSRVQFLNDIETRSNATTSSRPVGERWGGYEIPEPEKDLGKEVMYQITQQGFNELLNPLFQDREINAIDAYETRYERRKHAARIEEITACFKTQIYDHLRKICKMGVFRYTKCIVDMFQKEVNEGSTYSGLRGIFHRPDGTEVGREEAQTRLRGIITSVEERFLQTFEAPKDWEVDDLSLWNTWLCKNRLMSEVVATTLKHASRLDWISEPGYQAIPENWEVEEPSSLPYRDPTMPQFRPNSLADINVFDRPLSRSSSETESDLTDDDSEYRPSFRYLGTEYEATAHPTGPFFACTWSEADEVILEGKAEGDGGASAQLQPSLASPLDVVTDQDAVPATGSDSPPLPSAADSASAPEQVVHPRKHTNNPVIHLFQILIDNGVVKLQVTSRPVLYSTNPFYPELDQLVPLVRHIRDIAMDHNDSLHYILLASLETVQQEINERKGSGLISLTEFEEHINQGKLRFLEAWMEWVSI